MMPSGALSVNPHGMTWVIRSWQAPQIPELDSNLNQERLSARQLADMSILVDEQESATSEIHMDSMGDRAKQAHLLIHVEHVKRPIESQSGTLCIC